MCSAVRHSSLSAESTRNGAKLGHNGYPFSRGCDLEGALMDLPSQRQWIDALWILFGLYWIVSAFKLKKTKKRESWGQRFRYFVFFSLNAETIQYKPNRIHSASIRRAMPRRGSVLRSPPPEWPSPF